MADNTLLNSGTGGDTIATDDISGVKYQRVKLSLGADGVAADAPIGNGTAAGVLRVTLASDTTGVVGLAAGSAAIGKLAANSGVDIGDIDVTSIIPGVGATNLGKAEDAAHADGDTGVMSLAVRRDANTTLAGTTGDYAPLQVDASGNLKVAIISGAGSGGTSIADNAAFTRGTTSATPITGVVETSAPTLTNGNAGTLSLTTGGALRVAVASGGVAGVLEDAAEASGVEGIVAMAVRRDTAASSSGTDGDYSTLNTDANGRLHVIAALAATQTLATVTNLATIGTSVTPGTSAAHLGKAEDAVHASGDTGVAALAVRTDTAAASSGTTGDYEVLHTDSVGALWSRSTGELADDSAFTPATSRVFPVGFTADESSTDSVDEGDIGAARMTLDRKQIVSPYAHAAGGATPVSTVSAASTNATSLKNGAGTVYSVTATNVNAAVRYLKFYNKASAPTVGTDTPVYVFPLPGNTAGAGVTHSFPVGLNFSTGIAWALTVEATVAGTTGVSLSEHVVSIAYI